MRVMVRTLPPFLAAGLRHGTAGLLVLAWHRARGGAWPQARLWKGAARLGFFFLVAGNGLVTWCEQSVDSGVTALLVGSAPLWVALLLQQRGQRLGWVQWLSLLGGFGGVALLVGPSLAHPNGSLLGMLGVVAGAFSWAWGTVTAKQLPRPKDGVLDAGMQMVCAGAMLLSLALLSGEAGRVQWARVSAGSWEALAYLIVFGSLVGYLAFQWLLKHVSPASASTYAYVNPAVAVGLGWWLLGEALTPRLLIASACIVGSVAVTLALPAAASKA